MKCPECNSEIQQNDCWCKICSTVLNAGSLPTERVNEIINYNKKY